MFTPEKKLGNQILAVIKLQDHKQEKSCYKV